MRLRWKIGTHASCYLSLRRSPYMDGTITDERGYTEFLDHIPQRGDYVAWVEVENGKLETGRVDEIRGLDEDRLFFIERF